MTEESTAVATLDQGAMMLQAYQWDERKWDLVRRMYAADCSDLELEVFGETCQRTGLDPVAKQIYAIKRQGRMTIQTGIDGFRLIAQRTGRYGGQIGPFWCGQDEVWRSVWLDAAPPSAAYIDVLRTGAEAPFRGIATWAEYAQLNKDGRPTDMWKRMPANQLAKCAEAQGLRKAFPAELSGIYTTDEMEQADNSPREAAPAGNRGAAREVMRNAQVAPQGGLRERIGAPPAQPSADLPQWARDIIDQTQAWGRKMAEFAPLFGVEQVTPGAMRQWGNARLQDGGDPFKEATDWLRAKMQAEAPAEEPIDGEARELEDAINAEYDPRGMLPLAPEEASERVLDLPFAD